MSDAYTEVWLDGAPGMGLWGHVEPAEAVAATRKHYEHEAVAVAAALVALDSGAVRVYHQYGPYAARNRKIVLGETP
jgi:hypothetical protein